MGIEIIHDAKVIVRVTGEIDLANVAELESALDMMADKSPDGFIVDISQARYIDASSIRAILKAHERIRTCGGRIALVAAGMPKTLVCALDLDGLPGLSVYEDARSAIESLDH